MVNVGFTGSRRGMTELQLRAFLSILNRSWPRSFHHGDCVGADDEAATLVYEKRSGITRVIRHPPTSGTLRANNHCYHETRPEKPYLERNREIVDETQHLIAAVTGPEEIRSGTWSTIRYARKLGRQITICWPDGKITEEPMDYDLWAASLKAEV